MRPTYTARYEPDEDGWWCMTADCGEHGSANTQGSTLDEARARAREAIACLLDVPEDSFDIVEELASVEPM
jgi:predicted RNase H-like HicB family nuclease